MCGLESWVNFTTVERAAPNGQLRDEVNCIWISESINSFLPPPSRSGARNEPSAGAKTRLAPAIAPGRARGQITRRATAQRLA